MVTLYSEFWKGGFLKTHTVPKLLKNCRETGNELGAFDLEEGAPPASWTNVRHQILATFLCSIY
jgi:hypothetical protein